MLTDMQSMFMDYPMEVSIETQALCNARCTFCPYPTIERKGERMSDELLNKLADELISWNRDVYFSPFKLSEPLLDKRVIPLCERINRESDHVVLRFFSNGSALTPANIEKLANLKRLSYLWVSLNEYRPVEYEALMGLSFERVTKNLDYLHSVENFPHQVMLSCVGHPNEEFRRYCFDRWPRFSSMAIKKDSWLGFTDAQVLEVPDTPCSRWFELSITSSGNAVTCCMDSGDNPKYYIGNVNEQSLYEIYNAPRWKDRRTSLASRKTHGEDSPCSGCTY